MEIETKQTTTQTGDQMTNYAQRVKRTDNRDKHKGYHKIIPGTRRYTEIETQSRRQERVCE